MTIIQVMRTPDPTDAEAIYTPRQLRDRTGICAHRIRAACKSGELPSFKIGRWNRIRWNDYIAWLESHRVTPTDPVAADAEVEAAVREQLRREGALAKKREVARTTIRTTSRDKGRNDDRKSKPNSIPEAM